MMLYNIIISLTRQLHNSSRVHFFSYRELRFSDTSFPSNSHMLKLVWKEQSNTNNITIIWDRICSNNKSLSEKFTELSTKRDFSRATKCPLCLSVSHNSTWAKWSFSWERDLSCLFKYCVFKSMNSKNNAIILSKKISYHLLALSCVSTSFKMVISWLERFGEVDKLWCDMLYLFLNHFCNLS